MLVDRYIDKRLGMPKPGKVINSPHSVPFNISYGVV